MRVRQAAQQLRLVRAVLRAERRRGSVTADLAERAFEIVESTAVAIEGEADANLEALLAAARSDVAELVIDEPTSRRVGLNPRSQRRIQGEPE